MKNRNKNNEEKQSSDNNKNNPSQNNEENKKFPGYPHYAPSEDIYNQEIETDLNPEDPTKTKKSPSSQEQPNHKSFKDDMTGEDLDVPGSKADEAKANAGREDEENNYYSLGGDNHNDLEEDKIRKPNKK